MTTTSDDTILQRLAPRIIADTTLDAVIYADRSGVIRLWNDAAETLFGHTAAQAVGQSLDLIVPEKHRKAHWSGWERVMASGETRYGAEPLSAPGQTADGGKVALEFSITMLKDEDGRIEGIAAILRDAGRHWEKEKSLRARIAELEGSGPVA